MITIPIRTFTANIDGTIYRVRELSYGYILSLKNGVEDTVEAAIKDAMPEVDPESFTPSVRNKLYTEILKFTFPESRITNADKKAIGKAFNLTEKEILGMSEDSLLSLKATLEARAKPKKGAEKKH